MKWKTGTITLRGTCERTEYPATLYGPIAVHRNPDAKYSDPSWSLTHVATGLWIQSYRTKADAQASALRVLQIVPPETDGWETSDPKALSREFLKAVFDATFPTGHPMMTSDLKRKVR